MKERMKRIKALGLAAGILAGIAASVMNPVKAQACSAYGDGRSAYELTNSYIEYDNRPILMGTTGYCEGEITYSGQRVREGIVAACPNWIGMICIMYEAIPDTVAEEGYVMGGFIGAYEILDTGYGRSTEDGVQSKIRPDKDSRGTIEKGLCIDKWCDDLEKVKDWMRLTNGKAYCQIIPAHG